MKLISFLPPEHQVPLESLSTTGVDIESLSHLGLILPSQKIIDLTLALPGRPRAIQFFERYEFYYSQAAALSTGTLTGLANLEVKEPITLLAPLPLPVSLRDAYAFRQHVETSRKNRGLPMIPEFDEFPVFYFSNRLSVRGPGRVALGPHRLEKLDFELEVAVVTKKGGIDLSLSEAEECIAGFMIFNDLSARAVQMQEMKLSLGPAKGKDFANCLGPYFVSVEELKDYQISSPKGSRWKLEMQARVNGKTVSRGNFADMHFTFAEIIERMSRGCKVLPGEVIGSGTVGTGCFLELNTYPGATEQWLKPGDQVELEVEKLGILKNEIA